MTKLLKNGQSVFFYLLCLDYAADKIIGMESYKSNAGCKFYFIK